MATPNPRIQALILNSRIKEKLQSEMKKKIKQIESSKQPKPVPQPTPAKLHTSQESIETKDNIHDTESIEITIIKSSDDSHRNNNQSSNSLYVDHNVLRIKALEKLNDELIEQNKSLKQQLLISQSNCSLILNELAKTRKKLNLLIRA